ncbi:MAG: hypothetical protein WD489_05395 [Rhodovibrionaceae bacterium]
MIRSANNLNAAADLVSLFREGLSRSKLCEGEVVVVYADSLTSPQYPAAFLAAAKDLGAQAIQIVQPSIATGAGRAKPTTLIRDAMIAADFVIDVSTGGMLHANEQGTILDSGTRILRIREPEDCLQRMLPDAAVRARSIAGGKRLEGGDEIRIASDEGSDLTMRRGARKVLIQYGMADEPGRWDHWPTGMVNTTPEESSVEGELVIGPGSILFPLSVYVTEPLRLRFEGGVAVAIEGGREAVMLRDYIDDAGDENCRRLAHIGWGTEHRARWHSLAVRGNDGGGGAEARSIYGGVLLALGENRDLGGENAAPLHIDIALRRSRFELDGAPLCENGKFLDESLA